MTSIVEKLRSVGVAEDDFVTLSYTEGVDVWHINESHIQESASETSTASMLGGLLASGIPVSDAYSTGNILGEMRDAGILDDYDREHWFAEYLTTQLVDTIYDGEYALEYSTTQYDYKRGFCNISTEVRIVAGDLYAYAEDTPYWRASVDLIVSGFDVSVETADGTLTF